MVGSTPRSGSGETRGYVELVLVYLSAISSPAFAPFLGIYTSVLTLLHKVGNIKFESLGVKERFGVIWDTLSTMGTSNSSLRRKRKAKKALVTQAEETSQNRETSQRREALQGGEASQDGETSSHSQHVDEDISYAPGKPQ